MATCAVFPGLGATAKYCNQPVWPAMPAGLDYVSLDAYDHGAVEVTVVKAF